MKLNFQKLDIEIPVEIPVNFMISTGTGIPANRLILTGTGILPGSRSILDGNHGNQRVKYCVVSYLTMATEVGRSYVTMVTKGYSTGEWGGVATQKNRTLPQILNMGPVFFGLHPPPVLTENN